MKRAAWWTADWILLGLQGLYALLVTPIFLLTVGVFLVGVVLLGIAASLGDLGGRFARLSLTPKWSAQVAAQPQRPGSEEERP